MAAHLNYNWDPVINFETGGMNYYNKVLRKPTFPGGASGVTIGIGADLGYMTQNEFDTYFAKYFTAEERKALKGVIGYKGVTAKSALGRVKHIIFEWEDAKEAFIEWTLPKFWKLANRIWPGLHLLRESAQIALVSIVFNRGASLTGSTRREMRNLVEAVKNKDYDHMAREVKSMKRLWENKGLNGLLLRRDAEAAMILQG
jgi:GH24 family phage-related lysozyme (muramidase)